MLRNNRVDISGYSLTEMQVIYSYLEEEQKERERLRKEQKDKLEEKRQKRELEKKMRASSNKFRR